VFGLSAALYGRLDFDGLPSRQGVLVVYPHTSNWDFPIGVLAKWGIGMPVTFWGKDSLFRVPLFGAWLRWIGGVPVNRAAPGGIVAEMADRMAQAAERDEFLWLALAPEGSRSRGEGWRSGFYRVALRAGAPLALGHLDFGRKRIGVGDCLRLSGDEDADMAEIARRFDGVSGRRPTQANPIRLA
jgi:1-acyl-sn-glycerol-3-phosphate acyltransferase